MGKMRARQELARSVGRARQRCGSCRRSLLPTARISRAELDDGGRTLASDAGSAFAVVTEDDAERVTGGVSEYPEAGLTLTWDTSRTQGE